jgi:ATP-binding protein involved in chromosome partitioning|tara:strand:- start:4685 stop:5716 length:1032 start_codon:yes stop_codon:yes gene_type:complete
MSDKDKILNLLKEVNFPGFTRDIVSFGIVKNIDFKDKKVLLGIELPKEDQEVAKKIAVGINNAFSREGLELPEYEFTVFKKKGETANGTETPNVKLPNISKYLAVASGKGGVGKSTVAVNLAIAFAEKMKNIGLMDADIWGPSIPMMCGINTKPMATKDEKIIPIEKFNIKMMSIGFLLGEEDTVIWRGPMVHGAIKQFIEDVEWEGVDNLIIDLPPGTGDAHLSLIQTVPLSGGVIVTTPQDVALIDVKRGIQMFKKLNVPVLGIIENMSYLQDGDKIIDIFGRGGGKAIADKFEVPFLGEIPIDPEIRKGGDSGQPIVYSNPESETSQAFSKIAERIIENI